MKTSSLTDSTTLFEVKPKCFVSIQQLKDWLPTVESALWFAKVYKMDYRKSGDLLRLVHKSDVLDALSEGGHSTELQDYYDTIIPDYLKPEVKPETVDAPPPAEVLPELWESAVIEVARSIQEVADKLSSTLGLMPSKEGRMTFETMRKMNKQRPTLGVHAAQVRHQAVPDALIILDVSGSMTESTIRRIIDDVVALSWKANAHLAIVSDSCFHWEPGSYNVDDVLAKAEYWGTHYEQLVPLFEKDWGTVVTIADYDSAPYAKQVLRGCVGKIGTVLDISLVNRPTFLAECVGQLADEVKPLLVGPNAYLGYGGF